MKRLPILILIIVILFAGYSLYDSKKDNLFEISIADKRLNVEVAQTMVELTKGLMFREYLPDNQGMLFIFDDPGRHSFWMKNTLISLDIIWVDAEKNIIHIVENAPPCPKSPCISYAPDEATAKYVIEVNGGWVSSNNVAIGDRLDLKNLPY